MQTMNNKLIKVRETFDEFNLISSMHFIMSFQNKMFQNLLLPLVLLSKQNEKKLLSKLKTIKFLFTNDIAA